MDIINKLHILSVPLDAHSQLLLRRLLKSIRPRGFVQFHRDHIAQSGIIRLRDRDFAEHTVFDKFFFQQSIGGGFQVFSSLAGK
jgi:hypothetical protein